MLHIFAWQTSFGKRFRIFFDDFIILAWVKHSQEGNAKSRNIVWQ